MFDRLNPLDSGLLAAAVVAASWIAAPRARAEETNVARRISQCGEISLARARGLQGLISAAMKRAATSDAAVADPVRQAMTRVLTGAEPAKPAPTAHEVERRLRAGLDLWALQHLFDPEHSSVDSCSREFELSGDLCGALLAAARGETQAVTLGRRKDAYQQQRDAYLNRRLAELKARQARVLAASDSGPVRRGPASALEAEVVGLAPKPAAPAPAPIPTKDTAATPASKLQTPKGELAEQTSEPAVEPDFVEDLVADPLGKNPRQP